MSDKFINFIKYKSFYFLSIIQNKVNYIMLNRIFYKILNIFIKVNDVQGTSHIMSLVFISAAGTTDAERDGYNGFWIEWES